MCPIRTRAAGFLLLVLGAGGYGPAHANTAPETSLADLTLEQLSDLTVTSTRRRPERQADAAASVFVITRYDIERSGARTIPEALRLAPNLEVSEVRANVYAVSARGFQNLVTNKLLVLVDGRAVYTSVLSGVEWDALDVMMEDVDRIEVISGPGAALWGANAVDGVINIITKPAGETQGGLVTLGAGSTANDAHVRYGFDIPGGTMRAYAMHTHDDRTEDAAGRPIGDPYDKDQVGFRADVGDPGDSWRVSGDAYEGDSPHLTEGAVDLDGFNLVAAHERVLADGSSLDYQAYVDHSERVDPVGFHDLLTIADLSVQDALPRTGMNTVTFGGGYRVGEDRTTPTPLVRFIPEDAALSWANLFAQDDIALARDWSLTAGLKVEKDSYSGWEWLPDVRLSYKLDSDQMLWAGVSRAVREPARIDKEFFFPGDPPYAIRGGPTFSSEVAHILELGYKGQAGQRLNFSITGYAVDYRSLRSGAPAPGGGFYIVNQMSGVGSGIEAWATWQARPDLRLFAGLLELNQALHTDPGSMDPSGPSALGNDPRHSVKLRADWDVRSNVSVEVAWRYISALSYLPSVPAYNATDLTLVWKLNHHVELLLSARDLFHSEHVEFDDSGDPSEIPRSIYGQVRWTF